MSLHDMLAKTHPKLARGRVWCTLCGQTQRVDSADALAHGWPKCCGQTMTIDAPWGRAGLPDPDRYAYEAGRNFHTGYHYEWRDAADSKLLRWWVVADNDRRPCRWMAARRQCRQPSVAYLLRGHTQRRYDYCEDHLYGRILADGRLWDLILVADEAGR